jgi:hypothetical protein
MGAFGRGGTYQDSDLISHLHCFGTHRQNGDDWASRADRLREFLGVDRAGMEGAAPTSLWILLAPFIGPTPAPTLKHGPATRPRVSSRYCHPTRVLLQNINAFNASMTIQYLGCQRQEAFTDRPWQVGAPAPSLQCSLLPLPLSTCLGSAGYYSLILTFRLIFPPIVLAYLGFAGPWTLTRRQII